jgi:hypothetical protein
MSNTLLTPSVIAKEALIALRANTVFARLVHRNYEQEFGAKVGDSVTIRKPNTFSANEFTTDISTQAIAEGSTSVTLSKHLDVSAEVTAKELTLSLQDFSAQVVTPAMQAIAQKIDVLVASEFVNIAQYQDVTSTAVLSDLSALDRILNVAKAPMFDRRLVLGPNTKDKYISLAGFSDASQAGSAEALRQASLGRVYGMDTYMNQNIQAHAVGTCTAGNLSGTAGDLFGSIAAGTSGGTWKAGTVFTIADDTTQYVVTKDATNTTTTLAKLEFYPALKVTASGKAVTIHAASTENSLAFHKNAFALVSRPLALPMGAKFAAIESFEGFGVRVVYDYDITKKKDIMSFDILVGTKTLTPELAVRLIK